MIRQPAAFVSSLKIKNWGIGYSDLLKKNVFQSDNILSKYYEQILQFSNSNQDIIEQGILFWNMVHEKIHGFKLSHSNWLFMKHEDLSLNPVEEFERIFNYLGLPYTEEIITEIEKLTSKNPSPAIVNKSSDIFEVKRNSKENIWYWKERLTVDEIERIYNGTKHISNFFYSAKDW